MSNSASSKSILHRRSTRFLLLAAMLVLFSLPLSAQYFGQNKINYVDSDWSMISSLHFDLYFPRGKDDFGKLVSLMAEETYYKLKDDLRFPLHSRVPIIVYGTKQEFQATNIIYPLLTEGIGGFTESLRNRVVIPFEGSYAKLEELLAHELTHAYTNVISRHSLLSTMRPVSFPFWFSEGLPEFLSIGGEDDYNSMFILDMVVNDKLPRLDYSEGYLAYRLGESFLSYIAEVWGRDKVSEYYFALRTARSPEEATQKVFGMELEELEARWRYHLKRLYFPAVAAYGSPKEDFEQRSFSSRDGSYFNYMPRLAPDGQSYVYFSNAGARYSVWHSGVHGLFKPRKLITGENSGKMQEFHYFRANLSWFPDSRRVAFAAKASSGDIIHILDVARQKIVKSIKIPQLSGIYELDVSPDGRRILIAGQKDLQSDLFVYDLDSGSLDQLTDDLYWDAQPRWAPDGRSIVFASERLQNPDSKRRGMFANYRSGIFRLDLETNELWLMSDEDSNCSFPMYASGGNKLMYISSREGVSNYRVLDLEASARADVTNILAGVYAGDISSDDRYLVLSNYFDGAWDIYFGYNPLDSLAYESVSTNQAYARQGDMWDAVDFGRLDLYGSRPKSKASKPASDAKYDARRPFISPVTMFEYNQQDSLLLMGVFGEDERPTESSAKPPKVKKYRSGFAVEHIFGGAAYSSSSGALGYLELGMADIMGNHGIGLSANFSGRLEENNLMLSYLYLKKRSDYGIGLYNFWDDAIFRDEKPGPDDFFRYSQRQTGAYLLWRYPFSRFLRLETELMLSQRKTRWDYWHWNAQATNGQWNQFTEPEYDLVAAPGLSLVRDTALFGSTGPLVGSRAIGTIKTSITDKKLEYLSVYGDWRGYKLFSRRYAVAARALVGVSDDFDPNQDRAQYFSLGGFDGVRGHDSYESGHKKFLTSLELRFPFFDYIGMIFPVPLTIPNIRGTIFGDLGTVFNDYSQFQPFEGSRLKDLKLGYGFGPRLNLGYVVLRLDLAWASNLSRISKPHYFLSFSEDF